MSSKKCTRSDGPIMDADLVFPECPKPTTQLPDIACVIGMVKFNLRVKVGAVVKSEKEVIREVAKLVYSKWWHDTVYCLTVEGIVWRITELYKQYKEGWKRLRAGRETSAAAMQYTQIVETRFHLFDIFPDDLDRRDHCEDDWGVKMSPAEKAYYEDQKIERKQFCDRAADPVWYTAMMKKQRLRERTLQSKKDLENNLKFRSLKEIEEALLDSDEVLPECPDDTLDEASGDAESAFQSRREKRKSTFVEKSDDSLPIDYMHVRDSSRKVKDKLYRVLADLVGKGMSLNESVQAVLIVANGLFDRAWVEQEKTGKDRDTRDMLPSLRSIREALGLIETQALAQTVDKMVEGRGEGRMVTHAIDSTTCVHPHDRLGGAQQGIQ